jgi:hypothetical protein
MSSAFKSWLFTAVYPFDYGAPTGFRLALRHLEAVTAVISQREMLTMSVLGHSVIR